MGLQKLLLISTHSFICLGIFCFYMYHVRTAFEAQVGYTSMSNTERESLFRGEDALYYYFYKVIAKAPNFATGILRIINLNGIEYPHTVNVLNRFYVLPEVVIGGLYHMIRLLPANIIQVHSKLLMDENYLAMNHNSFVNNEMEFYLECVWMVGAFTVVLVYLHGVLFSGHIIGGLNAFISYFMLHSYASRIYKRPAARENFGFPAVYLQMLYISSFINNMSKSRSNFVHFIKMSSLVLVTSVALSCWQLSTVIFASQILILMLPWTLHSESNTALIMFNSDYILSQFLGILFAYHWSACNKRYFFAWQLAPAFASLLIPLLRMVKPNPSTSKTENSNQHSARVIPLSICISLLSHSTLIDILQATGYIQPFENTYTIYRDLLFHLGLNTKANFATTLLACNPEYRSMKLKEVWELADKLFLLPFHVHWVVGLLSVGLRCIVNLYNRFKCNSNESKKYALEHFLEENLISMDELLQKKNEVAFSDFLKVLSQYNYDYELYKKEKAKLGKKDTTSEHTDFINNVKRLKQQIDDNKKNISQQGEHSEQNSNKEDKNSSQQNVDDVVVNKSIDDNGEQPQQSTTPSSSASNANDKNNIDSTSVTKPADETNRALPLFHLTAFSYNYFRYGLLQLLVFAVIGIGIRKLFFLCFTQACVLTSICICSLSKLKLGSLYWFTCINTFIILAINLFLNIQMEYTPSKNHTDGRESVALDHMLHWIKANTERDAVFAGPIDIIGTVHLTTGRPIVNHAHLDMKHISERTEIVYSVFSRQQLADIYEQYSQLKIQYLIVALSDCKNEIRDECDLLSIWDDIQPAYRNQPQFCSEMITDKTPASWNVYINKHYAIVMMFSRSVLIHLKEYKLAEYVM